MCVCVCVCVCGTQSLTLGEGTTVTGIWKHGAEKNMWTYENKVTGYGENCIMWNFTVRDFVVLVYVCRS
jgi:hypothetical protein